jgi:VWFA-related protein
VATRLALIVLTVLALGQQQPPPPAQPPAAAQDPQRPVFRGGTQYVRVDAYPSIEGRIIEGLTAADFELFEDGKPQDVAAADFVPFDDLPEDDRGINVTPREGLDLAADSRYRVIVLVVDRESFDRSQWSEVRDSLIKFLETEITPRDLLALITTDKQWSNLALGKRVSEIQRELDTPEWIAPVLSEQRMALLSCGMETLQGRIRADETYALLEGLVQLFGQVREDRTSIIYVANGLSRQGPDKRAAEQRPLSMPASVGLVNGRIQRIPRANDMHQQFCKTEVRRLAETDFNKKFDGLIDLARASNVAFYPVAVPMMVPALPIPRNSPMAKTVAKVAVRRDGGLGYLAAGTDGLLIPAWTDVHSGLKRVVQDTTAHYLLGYYSTNPKADGKVRTIKVRLKKTGGLVRSRPFYRAPTKKDIKVLAEAAPKPVIVAPAHVVAALDTLSHSRPSAQFFTHAGIAGSMLSVVVEVPPAAVEAGRWRDGGSLEVIADTSDGETTAMGRGRLTPNGRAVLHVPITGPRPTKVLVRLRVEGESLVERITLPSEAPKLAGDPIGYRSGPRGLAIPVGLYEFARDEKLRLDWPLTAKPDKLELKLLDRYGQALKHKVAPAVVDTADGPHAIVEAVLSPLGRGDYVIELLVTRGAVSESKVLAFRMK